MGVGQEVIFDENGLKMFTTSKKVQQNPIVQITVTIAFKVSLKNVKQLPRIVFDDFFTTSQNV